MEHEGSLRLSQEHATGPHPESHVPSALLYFSKIHSNITLSIYA